jgi:putative transposase
LSVARATLYRYRHPPKPQDPPRAPRHSHRRLSDEVRAEALELAHSPRFQDVAPVAIVATLLDDDGRYLCSPRTLYRLLAEHGETSPRRRQRTGAPRPAPQLVARQPNEVWCWDITQLPGIRPTLRLFLYLVLDLYSRYLVGWMVAQQETSEKACQLLETCLDHHCIEPGQLILHADRGAPMRSALLGSLLDELGVGKSFSRPRTADDNAFIEAGFRTAKYHPSWPERFTGLDHAQRWARQLVYWYNHSHRHSSLLGLTPATVFEGRADDVLARRHQVLVEAWRNHPERFPQGCPRRQHLPAEVWINQPNRSMLPDSTDEASQRG